MKKLARSLAIVAAVSVVGFPGAASAFEIGFEWGDIPLCTTGNPNTVPNPVFRISNPPAGAAQLQFRLVDRDVPSYNHGGGRITYGGQAQVPSGVFSYRSPCPPRGKHTYEWQVTAFDAQGQVIGRASARRDYPG